MEEFKVGRSEFTVSHLQYANHISSIKSLFKELENMKIIQFLVFLFFFLSIIVDLK